MTHYFFHLPLCRADLVLAPSYLLISTHYLKCIIYDQLICFCPSSLQHINCSSKNTPPKQSFVITCRSNRTVTQLIIASHGIHLFDIVICYDSVSTKSIRAAGTVSSAYASSLAFAASTFTHARLLFRQCEISPASHLKQEIPPSVKIPCC